MSTASDRLYERLGPLAAYDPENGNVVQALAETFSLPQDVVDEVARDTDTQLAWQPALDPDTCPAEWLLWLAQFPGVTLLPSDLTEAAKRARIKAATGFYRGTKRAMVEVVQATLTDTRSVQVLTHVGGDMWAITVVVRTSECPSPALSERAALSQKPAGQILTFVVSDEPIIDEGALTIDTAADVPVDNLNLGDV